MYEHIFGKQKTKETLEVGHIKNIADTTTKGPNTKALNNTMNKQLKITKVPKTKGGSIKARFI